MLVLVIFFSDISSPLHVDSHKIISKFYVKYQGKKFCLSLLNNGSNNYIFANVLKMYQFNTKLDKIDIRMTFPLII